MLVLSVTPIINTHSHSDSNYRLHVYHVPGTGQGISFHLPLLSFIARNPT
jgi:hypothetical protein